MLNLNRKYHYELFKSIFPSSFHGKVTLVTMSQCLAPCFQAPVPNERNQDFFEKRVMSRSEAGQIQSEPGTSYLPKAKSTQRLRVQASLKGLPLTSLGQSEQLREHSNRL